jgi:hypothetical protein
MPNDFERAGSAEQPAHLDTAGLVFTLFGMPQALKADRHSHLGTVNYNKPNGHLCNIATARI